MARWEANPRERLTHAALALFAEHGYDDTSVADIAERAGLTKSTFFRHFDDKREVLFGGQDDMVVDITKSVAAIPPGEPPLSYLTAVLAALAGFFPDEQRPLTATRAAVIAAHPELRERDLLKRAHLTADVEDALRSRGIDDVMARLAASIGVLAIDTAYRRWASRGDPRGFGHVVVTALQELVAEAAAFAQPSTDVPTAFRQSD